MHALLTAVILAPALALPAQATCTVGRVTSVPVTFSNGYVYLPVTMNNATGLFMLDTGSAETIIDKNFADESGAGMDRHGGRYVLVGAGDKESLPGFKAHVRMTTVGNVRFQDWEYLVADLHGPLHATAHAAGILGMDFLHFFDLELDVPTKTLTIYRLSGCKDVYPPSWKGDYDTIPLTHTPSHNVTIPVFLDNAFLNMEFDTGAGSGVLLTRDAAAKAGVSETMIANDTAHHGLGLGGGFATAQHHFKMFLVGSGVYPDANLTIENERTGRGETDGLIGLEALHATRIWISFATNSLFVQGAPKLKQP